jgi:cobalamin-dependent methionine synthase I
MRLIGEKINGTRASVADAIRNRDKGFIADLALRQVKAGVSYLDVHAGTRPEDEPADMVWLIDAIQQVTDVTLCLDSANPLALAAGLDAVKQKPMINSLSGEKSRVENVLPWACRYETELVVLAMDDRGIPKSVDERLSIVRSLVRLTRDGRLPDEKLYIDPLISAVATDTGSGSIAFETMRRIKGEFPDVHLTSGLSNISFGLPARSIINQAFAVLAIEAGLDSAILDPENVELRGIMYAAELVLGRDRRCQGYTNAYRAGLIGRQDG